MRIGITGAGGFIGKALARRARQAGHEVVGLDVSAAEEKFYAELGACLMKGDITVPEDVRRFSAGIERVYHTAAVVQESGDWDLFEKVNVGGSANVAEQAKAAGVRELVQFSSVMVYGFDYPDEIGEEGPLRGDGNPYCTTKIASERAVLAHHAPGSFDVYVIRPGDVYGPGSVPWTIRPVAMMKQRKWLYVNSRRCLHNHVYIDNLLDGIELVLDKRMAATPFVVSDDARTTVREFFSHYERALGIGFIPDVPEWLGFGMARTAGAFKTLTGFDFGADEQSIRYITRKGKYSCEKLKALGYRPRVGLDEGMARCREWLASEGMLGR